jgi:exodeoxyribonuclease VII small subunit
MLERKVKIYMAKSQTIEQSFEKLDEILKSLEQPDISLDEALKIYNEGIKLVKNCNQQLDKVEKQIIVLSDKEGGYDEL